MNKKCPRFFSINKKANIINFFLAGNQTKNSIFPKHDSSNSFFHFLSFSDFWAKNSCQRVFVANLKFLKLKMRKKRAYRDRTGDLLTCKQVLYHCANARCYSSCYAQFRSLSNRIDHPFSLLFGESPKGNYSPKIFFLKILSLFSYYTFDKKLVKIPKGFDVFLLK